MNKLCLECEEIRIQKENSSGHCINDNKVGSERNASVFMYTPILEVEDEPIDETNTETD